VQFTKVNETARLEWLDVSRLTFRFEYSNRFYGSCSFAAHLRRKRNQLALDQNSLSAEDFTIKRGNPPTLLNLAVLFLNSILLNYRVLEDLDDKLTIAAGGIQYGGEKPAELI